MPTLTLNPLEDRTVPALLRLAFADAPLLREGAPAIEVAARALDRTLTPGPGRPSEWRVYVDAVPLPADRLAEASPFGAPPGFDAVVRISTLPPWHTGATVAGLEPGEFDLFTAAGHELIHALGVPESGHAAPGTAAQIAAPVLPGRRELPSVVDFVALISQNWLGGVPVRQAVRLVSVRTVDGRARLLAELPDGRLVPLLPSLPFHLVPGDFDGDGSYEWRVTSVGAGFDAIVGPEGAVRALEPSTGAGDVLVGGLP